MTPFARTRARGDFSFAAKICNPPAGGEANFVAANRTPYQFSCDWSKMAGVYNNEAIWSKTRAANPDSIPNAVRGCVAGSRIKFCAERLAEQISWKIGAGSLSLYSMKNNSELVKYLVDAGALKTPRIKKAFSEIDRADFVPERLTELAYEDAPLPIGQDATISQPYVVAFMLELLQPQQCEKILDIGSGSGWTTALLAHIVSQKGMTNNKTALTNSGSVFAIERALELKSFGEKNCAKYNFVEKGIARFVCADGTKGLEVEAPFDAIQAAAAASQDIPIAWKNQLKIGGRIVAPIGHSVWRFIKKSETEFSKEEYYGFAFVPLVSGS